MLSSRPTCVEVLRELEAEALGELGLADARAVARHLAACPECARESAAVRGLVGELRAGSRASAGRVPARRVVAASVLAAGIACMIALSVAERRAADPASTGPILARPPELSGLIASQGSDGAWREPGIASEAFTIGVSGLATLACLEQSGADPGALAASERGCDYLVAALRSGAGADPAASIDLRLRAQAAAALALEAASRRWPGRYGREAGKAIAALRDLAESWPPAEGSGGPSEVTRLLVSVACRGPGARPSPGGAPADHRILAARLAASSGPVPGRGPLPVSGIASRVLADARARRNSPTF